MHLQLLEAVSLLKKFSAEGALLQGVFVSRSGNIEASVVGNIGYVEDAISSRDQTWSEMPASIAALLAN